MDRKGYAPQTLNDKVTREVVLVAHVGHEL